MASPSNTTHSTITLVPLMNSLLPLHSIASPYLKAARLFYRSTTAIAHSLSSDRALSLYKKTAWLAWLLAQLAFWASILAMKQTLLFGQAARRYYEAEWSSDVETIVNWLLTYPDQCIEPSDSEEKDAPGAPDAIATSIPQNIQVILGSDRTTTNKLRAVATQCNINWRHAHSHNKHMSNQEIRNALAAFPTILKQL